MGAPPEATIRTFAIGVLTFAAKTVMPVLVPVQTVDGDTRTTRAFGGGGALFPQPARQMTRKDNPTSLQTDARKRHLRKRKPMAGPLRRPRGVVQQAACLRMPPRRTRRAHRAG